MGRGGERFTTGLGDWWVARLNGVKWTPGPKEFYHVIGGGAVVDLKKFDPAKAKWVAPASVRQPIPLHECGGINSGWQLQPGGVAGAAARLVAGRSGAGGAGVPISRGQSSL